MSLPQTAQIRCLILAVTVLAFNYPITCIRQCHNEQHSQNLRFSLVRRCQRSQLKVIDLENTLTLEECFVLAKKVRGLALNYSPLSRRNRNNTFEKLKVPSNYTGKMNRQHFWQQPQVYFNCHILQCPENSTFRSMVNDSRFDYFSLYGKPIVSRNYTCSPEVGVFLLQTVPLSYTNASTFCSNITELGAALAHVTSEIRTNALSALLANYNERHRNRHENISTIHLAFVGLHFNRSITQQANTFLTADNENLKCFLYRAWSPGYPKENGVFVNSSCVAITTQRTWITVECTRPLPFICEIYTSKPERSIRENEDYVYSPDACSRN